MSRIPPPWSFSSLDTHVTCARKYHEERVLKTVVDVETEAQRKGTADHKAFEDRIRDKVPLPADLLIHEPFMQKIEAYGGEVFCERKVGLTRQLKPCDFFAPDVWWRGVLDVQIKLPNGRAVVIDYKTGRPHNKMRQLHLFSVYCFIEGADQVETMFYWTRQPQQPTRIILPKAQLGPIMKGLVPDLSNYVQAFKLDIWPPKPNGLCQNYCGVVGCEHHGKRMGGR